MKGRSLTIFLVALVVLCAIVYFFIAGNSPKYSWYENYHYDNDQPYGCTVASQMLQGLNKGKSFSIMKEPLHKSFLPWNVKDSSLYVFIGNDIYYDSAAIANLLSFVAKGNDAFIACPNIPYDLMSHLTATEDTATKDKKGGIIESEKSDSSETDSVTTVTKIDSVSTENENYNPHNQTVIDSIVCLNFFNPLLQTKTGEPFDYVFNFKRYRYYWNYFSIARPRSNLKPVEALGYIQVGTKTTNDSLKFVNFIRLPYEKGYFYFHYTPLAFTNYSLVKQSGFDYADKVFGQLKPANIYWDEGSKIPSITQHTPGVSQSPLSFILSQDSLRWAWYILLVLLLLFVLFRMKREQGIIPIPEPNLNTSSEFVETIGRLYFLQNDHIALAQQKMKLFLQFVRHKYNLSTRELDEAFISRLSEKARVSLADVKDIFVLYKINDRETHLSTQGLIEFHHAIDKFYKQCK